MADVSFSQPERRSFALPILLAFLLLAVGGLLLFRYTPHTTADVSITHVDVVPTHVVFKSETNVVGAGESVDTLYVLVTLRITDRLRLPLFLKDFTGKVTDTDGAVLGTSSAVERGDLLNLYASFPAVKKVAAAEAAPPLLRESRIDPGQTAEGFVILHFPITPQVWQARKAAVLSVDFYHQPPISLTLPNTGPQTPPPGSKAQ